MEPQRVILPDDEVDQIAQIVAKRVEDKLFAKFGKWVVVNLIMVGGISGGGLVAFFNLKSDVQSNALNNSYQDQRIADQIAAASLWRTEVNAKLARVEDKLDQLNTTLANHNGRVLGTANSAR